MLYYDVNYQNVGVSSTLYVSLEGEFEINLYEDIRAAFNAAAIFPLNDYRNPSALETNYAIYVTVNPLLKIQSGLNNVPFGSTPEARYKIGSYAYIKGWEIIPLEDDTFQSIPYESEPTFLNYERSALKAGYFIFDPDVPFQEALRVETDSASSGATPVIPRIASPYYSGSFALSYCAGISLNLNPGILADVVISYQYAIISAVNDPVYPDYYDVY